MYIRNISKDFNFIKNKSIKYQRGKNTTKIIKEKEFIAKGIKIRVFS